MRQAPEGYAVSLAVCMGLALVAGTAIGLLMRAAEVTP